MIVWLLVLHLIVGGEEKTYTSAFDTLQKCETAHAEVMTTLRERFPSSFTLKDQTEPMDGWITPCHSVKTQSWRSA